ncbi:sensor histidine kinase [Phyllobacterium myrsinacearum]|uniref:histidine kinase n=1 Tax=Phyllobacterium myrsinacearum TaxID=28101 RepID=A0A839ET45_9HYPH|nr:sensor histidine kinase [Phyllobacterium myrsinacearum]MBA8882109.1 two-component system sensor histidine kinase TctE [Phyllobacterium myrsinacearum]
MRLISRLPGSLRVQLVSWIVIPLIIIAAINLWVSWNTSEKMADLVTDRMLTASARAIGEATAASGNTLDAIIPPVAIEMFSTGDGDHVYYSVATSDRQLLTGYPDLPVPPALTDFDPVYFNGSYRDQPVRLVALRHPVAAAPASSQSVDVIVGVTLAGHTSIVRDLWLHSVSQQLVLIAFAAALSLLGLRYGLRPLMKLRDDVQRRDRDLEPFDPAVVQTELQPLVAALNQYMDRVRKQMAAQRRFIQNAAHQLRTPIATLTTQASFALRTQDGSERAEVLGSIKTSAMLLARLAAQLLTLSRAEPGSRRPRADRVDLVQAGQLVLESLAGKAFDRRIDLGFEATAEAAIVTGDGTMLREMIVNLVDNALTYTPEGGSVTLGIARDSDTIRLTVEDSGPGIPEHERDHVFERFYRIAGVQADGSGLGLAIVREVTDGAGGTVALSEVASGGLLVTVNLPAATTV